VEGKKKYHVEILNRFADLADFDSEVEINSAWEKIREIIKISAIVSVRFCKLKKHKLRFDKGNKSNCSGYRIQIK
jgi:hypothetical protein